MLAALACSLGVAQAQRAGSSVAATAQFDKGRALMKQKKYPEACAAFEHSHALDPQQGTLYNLAICYSLTGKLASSWAAFRELAQRDTNPARKKDSSKRAAALEKRLPRLVLQAAATPGLAVTLDGVDVTPLVNTDNPVDLGEHKLHAAAPGHKDTDTIVSIKDEGKTVTIPLELTPLAGKPAPKVATASPDAARSASPRAPSPKVAASPADPPAQPVDVLADPPAHDAPARSHRRLYGVIVGGAGLALAATGLYFGKRAGDKWDEAKLLCGDDRTCDDNDMLVAGNQLVKDARSQANLATGFVIAGGVAVVAGVVLFVTAPRHETRPATAVRVLPSPDSVILSFDGRF